MHEEPTVTVTYLSHSCFEVKDDNHTLLVDPFLQKIDWPLRMAASLT